MPASFERCLLMGMLIFLSAFSSPAQLSTTVKFYYISQDPVSGQTTRDPSAVTLEIPLEIAYRGNTASRWEEFPIQNKIIPVYTYDDTRLHVRFKNASLQGKKLQVEIRSAGGELRPVSGVSQIIEISRTGAEGLMPILVANSPQAPSVTIKISKYEGHSLDPASSGEAVFANLRIVSFAELNRDASSQDLATRAKAYAEIWEHFRRFNERGYNRVSGSTEIRAILAQIQQKLPALESQMKAQASASLQGLKSYYQAFGSKKFALTAPYYEGARTLLQNADESEWSAVANNHAAAQAYLADFGSIADYECRHCAQAKTIVPSGPAEPPPAFDCNAAYQRAIALNSRRLLIEFLNKCPGASPDRIARAKQLLANMTKPEHCQDLFAQMMMESSDRSALIGWIERLRNECVASLDPRQLGMLDSLAYLSGPLLLNSLSDPHRMGNGKYVYHAHFRRKTFLSVAAIDGRADSSSLYAGPINWAWLAPDSLLQLIVSDNQDHRILVQSRSGDTLTLQITSRAFEGSITQTGSLLEIHLTNGAAPFRVEFIQKGKKYLLLLNEPNALIRLDSLPAAYNGAYQVIVKDRYQRQIDGGQVNIEQPFQWSLWHWMILPFLALAGWLTYRNQPMRAR